MKQSRLVLAAALLACLGTWAAIAVACSDKTKTTAATASTKSAASGVCTAEMAKNCTPEMAAACMATKGASAKTASAKTISADACCATKSAKTSATTASSVAPVGKVNAMAVSSDGCASKGTSATTAEYTSGKTTAVAAGSSCGTQGKTTAVAAGSSCSAHGSTAKAGKASAHGCEACSDMAMCEEEIKASGANVQIVPLKNGVMYVYAAEGPAKVQAVQAAMSRRTDRIAAVLAAGDKAKLCPDCKSMRGAMASGKLTRETVNIEGGCLTLMTSTDAAVVAKIHSMSGVKTLAHAKS